MKLSGPLQKMSNDLTFPIRYRLNLGGHLLLMNDLVGRELSFHWTGKHRCFCGHLVDQVHERNFCRDCFFTKPEASMTIMKPELSTAHLGIEERDLEFEKRLQLQPHYVYLAKTNEIKVGVTRNTQMPYRWMDQGAAEATILLEVPNRYLAGEAEVLLKEHFVDKTNWRSMLKNEPGDGNLEEAFHKAISLLTPELKEYARPEFEHWTMEYPVQQYPSKITSIKLDRSPQWTGVLEGIRGQYLLTSKGVFNVRAHEGYIVDLEF